MKEEALANLDWIIKNMKAMEERINNARRQAKSQHTGRLICIEKEMQEIKRAIKDEIKEAMKEAIAPNTKT